jgi:hypothetical protein
MSEIKPFLDWGSTPEFYPQPQKALGLLPSPGFDLQHHKNKYINKTFPFDTSIYSVKLLS